MTKKPYTTPRLGVHGTVEEITLRNRKKPKKHRHKPRRPKGGRPVDPRS